MILIIAAAMWTAQAHADDAQPQIEAAFKHLTAGDFEKARLASEPLAAAGDPDAQHLMGYIYEKGLGVARDMKRALSYYAKAAAQGQADAQYALGDLAFTGDGVARDFKRAAGWYRLASGRAHPGAKTQLGLMYAEGLGVAKDMQKAVAFFKEAAAMGDADAQYHLGALYLAGEGRDVDYKKAAAFFEQAGVQGHTLAQFNLALLYDGQLIPAPNGDKTARWMRLAAEAGMPDALVAMGLLAHQGRAGEDLAADWFERAAQAGDPQGQFLFAVALSEGDGREKDPTSALQWVEKALANEKLEKDARPGAEALARALKNAASN